ncbi:MAG TPA: GAF domain-containing protein [Pricia antarctica]|uniref:GAF domain-containing protein n=2 Tax=root TaxID=1 RepID=A0A831QMG8_9FLAO|nr:GAF domain-containing protein [Pricia antarctica]
MDISKRNNITASLQQNPIDWQKILLDSIACFGCSTGTLHFLDSEKAGDADTNMLQLKAQVGIPEFLLPKVSQIPIGKGMAGIAAERRKPVEMCNLQTDTSGVARPAAKETKVEGSIAIPLMLNDVLYGTLGIAKPVPYEFTEAERDELMGIGEEIAKTLA